MSFGFLSPLFLTLIPLTLGVLWFVYRHGGKAPAMIVSSVFLLRQLSSRPQAPQRFRPPLRVLFELLLALVLIAGALGLFLRQEGLRTVLVLDNSLSMGARVLRGAQGTSFLELAKQEASQVIESLPISAQVELWTTSPTLRALTDGFVSRSKARAELQGITATYASDNLATSLAYLSEQRSDSRIVIVSDRRIRTTAGSKQIESRVVVPLEGGALGSSLNNLAITEARVVSGGGEGGVSVLVGVRLFTPHSDSQAVPISVSLEAFDLEASKFRVLQELSQKVSPNTPHELRFKVPEDAVGLRVRARITSEANTRASDSLSADNFAFLTLNPPRSSVLVVSDLSADQLGLRAAKAINVEVLTPEQFSARAAEDPRELAGKAVLFHRFLPPQPLNAPAIVIMPPAGNETFKVSRIGQRGQATRWRDDHELTTYVNFSLLSLPQQQVLEVPSWGLEVFRTTEGSALYAGEFEGNRTVVAGFELFPYEGKKSPLLSILLLNMLRWVSDAAFDRTSPTFSRVSVADDVEAVMLATGEGAEFVPLSIETRGGARYVSAVEPGLLIGIQPGSKSILGAVNFLDPEESQLFTADAIEVSSPRLSSLSGDSAELLGSRSLIEWCALAALLLFLLDLLWWVAVSVVRFKQSRSQHAT